MRQGRRGLFILLTTGILLPGAILAVFGLRSLRQDQLLAEQQTSNALQSAGDVAAREAARELARWQTWAEPGSAILTLRPDGSLHGARGLLWLPGVVAEPSLSPDLEAAEQAEIRQQDYPKALRLYEDALRTAAPERRARIFLRIARTARKAGNLEKALRSWRHILSLPESPASAAARFGLVELGGASALDLYRDLVSGRFSPARESFFFYSVRARELAGDAAVAEFRELERRRRALTEAAESFLAAPRRNPAPGFFAFWEPGQAVLISEEALYDSAGSGRPRGTPRGGNLTRAGQLCPLDSVRQRRLRPLHRW